MCIGCADPRDQRSRRRRDRRTTRAPAKAAPSEPSASSPSVSRYAVSISVPCRMKAYHSASSHPMARRAPIPATSQPKAGVGVMPTGRSSTPIPAQQEPVAEVIGVVPPGQRVVQVQGVAGDIDEERRHDQREPGPRQRLGAAASASPQSPHRRYEEHQQWVGDEPGPESLAGELRQPRREARHEQLPHGGDEDPDCDPACHRSPLADDLAHTDLRPDAAVAGIAAAGLGQQPVAAARARQAENIRAGLRAVTRRRNTSLGRVCRLSKLTTQVLGTPS